MIYKTISDTFHRIRVKFYKLHLKAYGHFTCGKNVYISPLAKVLTSFYSAQQKGHINIADNCEIKEYVHIHAGKGNINIGENTTLNQFCVLDGRGGISIGRFVRIANHCSIIAANHNFDDLNTPIYKQGLNFKGITIEDDVWLGSGVKILDGVTIGKGAVIGAGSVVTKDIPPLSVAVGVPAKVIKTRS
jgi:acetyltransferase-like isoleucine patch superfamily enzyme